MACHVTPHSIERVDPASDIVNAFYKYLCAPSRVPARAEPVVSTKRARREVARVAQLNSIARVGGARRGVATAAAPCARASRWKHVPRRNALRLYPSSAHGTASRV